MSKDNPVPSSVKIIIAVTFIVCGILIMMIACQSTESPVDQSEIEVVKAEAVEVGGALAADDPEPETMTIWVDEPAKVLYHCFACSRNMEDTHRIDIDGIHYTDICGECLAYFKTLIAEAPGD